jgi:ribulose bisphosphate carboxylase small subunit
LDVEIFNLKKLSEVDVRKQCHSDISNGFADLENLHDRQYINKAWENIKQNIKLQSLGLYELKEHKPGFDDECLRYFDSMKQAKI